MTKHSVCFFGDEVLLGLHDAEGDGWARRLAKAERQNGHLLVPYVMAVEGETTASVAERWEKEARSRLTGLPASAIVFCFGLHDQATLDQDIQVPIFETLSFAETILKQATEWRTVFWVGPPPVARGGGLLQGRHRAALEYDQLRLRALSQGFAEIAERCGVPYLDLCASLHGNLNYMHSLHNGQGVLPDDFGQALITENLQKWKPWRQWLDQGISPNFCKIA